MNAATMTMDEATALGLRALACLIDYPDTALREALPELRAALHAASAAGAELSARRLEGLDRLIETIAGTDALDAEAEYVRLFDSGRAAALHLFEHVHGDSRERGPALVDLQRSYEEAGLLLAPGELPDYLPVLLEFASTQPFSAARDWLVEVAHLLNRIHGALRRYESPYAEVLAAIVELSGEPLSAPEPLPEAALDERWAEPPAFDGCMTQGQRARPLTARKPLQNIDIRTLGGAPTPRTGGRP